MEHFLSTDLTLGLMSNITTKRGSEDSSIAFPSFFPSLLSPLFPFLLSSYNWPLMEAVLLPQLPKRRDSRHALPCPCPALVANSFEFYGTWRNRGLHYQFWEKARTGWWRVDSFFGLSLCALTFGKEKRCPSWISCVPRVRVLLPWLQFRFAPLWIFAHDQICVWREKEQSTTGNTLCFWNLQEACPYLYVLVCNLEITKTHSLTPMKYNDSWENGTLFPPDLWDFDPNSLRFTKQLVFLLIVLYLMHTFKKIHFILCMCACSVSVCAYTSVHGDQKNELDPLELE